MTTSSRSVAIVGAGLSGLATAAKLHLQDPTIAITLFESSDRVGGVIDSEQVGDFLIDHGADMFATEPSGVIELCRQLGIDDQLIEPERLGRGAKIVRRGRLIPVPEGFVVMRATRLMPMLTTPLLSPTGKLRFLAERWIKPREQADGSAADESIGSFVRRRMGRQVLDRLVTPLAAGIYTGDVDRLSMLATMGPVAEMERRYGSLTKANRANRVPTELTSAGARYDRFRSFRGGMVELINGLARSLPAGTLRTSTTVSAIDRMGQKMQVAVEANDGDRSEIKFDHVVVATPPRVTGRLIADIASPASRELLEIEATSTAIVVLGLRRSDIREDISMFGFVVPPAEKRKILAGSFASNKFAGRAPEGTVLVRCFFGGALQSETLSQSDDQLIELARQELSELIGLSGTPLVTRVVRWNEAMPQYHVGHLDRVARIQEEIDRIPGLTLISNALSGVGIASVIRSADQAANEVIGSFTNSSDAAGRGGVDATVATE